MSHLKDILIADEEHLIMAHLAAARSLIHQASEMMERTVATVERDEAWRLGVDGILKALGADLERMAEAGEKIDIVPRVKVALHREVEPLDKGYVPF